MSVVRAVGRVTKFEEVVGLGEVTSDDGEVFLFHCTSIADGSRTINVDTKVNFVIVPGHGGRYEATQIAG